jgi:ATP-dependent DNA helicase DinG
MFSWQQHFPFSEWRQSQADGLDFICSALTEADNVMLEAPTGIGKSAVALALARAAAQQGARTYISTTTISLENQYIGDFHKLGLRQLHARNHYDCPIRGKCDVGKHCRCESERTERFPPILCPYEIARDEFYGADFSIANADFLCTSARFLKSWQPRELAIFDEAHLLHDTVAKGYSFNVWESEVQFFPMEGDEPSWLEQYYSHWLAVQIRELQEKLDEEVNRKIVDHDAVAKLCWRLERAEQKRSNLDKILADDPQNWIFDQQLDRLVVSPLWASSFAANLLPRIGQKRIFLSATLPGFEHQAKYLGLDLKKLRYRALPSPFPLKNRLVHIVPLVKWDYHDQTSALITTARALEKILKLHPTDRGIVHVSSYRQAREIVELCHSKRLVTHNDAREKDACLDEMFAQLGAVLVSPSSHEGLDLYGDRSRFQVIAKLPYASLGDKRVKRRMEMDPDWYTLHTAQKMIQACGRSIRSDTDYATTYLLDAGFERFYHRAYQFFPDYMLEAFRTGEVPL